MIISIWPSLIASGDPLQADLDDAQKGSEPGHPFGFDPQARDVYTRLVYGTRTSVTVGVCATLGVALLGVCSGALPGFFGGDGVLSRVTDALRHPRHPRRPGLPLRRHQLQLLLARRRLHHPARLGRQIARIAGGSVITAKQNDYVQAAARSAPPTPGRRRATSPRTPSPPVIVVATIALAAHISPEATLSYLGVRPETRPSLWGIDISAASNYIRNAPHMLLWPAGALAVTCSPSSCSATRYATASTPSCA
ncbi:ABC transporter permease OS=Streptomyces microflavus OX=1919 GN=G3I39_01785 PE=3 SV=1 [Streptomyces microflavus]